MSLKQGKQNNYKHSPSRTAHYEHYTDIPSFRTATEQTRISSAEVLKNGQLQFQAEQLKCFNSTRAVT